MKYLQSILVFISILMVVGFTFPMPAESDYVDETEYVTIDRCVEPLTWTIGTIDPRYDIDRETLKNIMEDVSQTWSGAVNKKILAYSDSADVTINFIYSDEQKYTDSEQKLSRQMNSMKMQYHALKQDYRLQSHKYQTLLSRYNESQTEYINLMNEFNRTISRYSDTGVIPREEKEKLKNLRKQADLLRVELESELDTLNEEAKNLEQLTDRLNSYADRVNEVIYQYKEQFGQSKTFHQGIYINTGDQRKINIYQFSNINKLKLVLAHEVGHALGLDHVYNPQSIMYYLMEAQNTLKLTLTEEDIQAIQLRCNEAELIEKQ